MVRDSTLQNMSRTSMTEFSPLSLLREVLRFFLLSRGKLLKKQGFLKFHSYILTVGYLLIAYCYRNSIEEIYDYTITSSSTKRKVH
jgi:hypothetical protein